MYKDSQQASDALMNRAHAHASVQPIRAAYTIAATPFSLCSLSPVKTTSSRHSHFPLRAQTHPQLKTRFSLSHTCFSAAHISRPDRRPSYHAPSSSCSPQSPDIADACLVFPRLSSKFTWSSLICSLSARSLCLRCRHSHAVARPLCAPPLNRLSGFCLDVAPSDPGRRKLLMLCASLIPVCTRCLIHCSSLSSI
ncbi:hypothetical protein EI94DRAFT_1177643 [Lactarius quietus]|nr:hypothetical protein EI94DRAFT_1177643 [Lactarius quietus]